MPLPPLPRSGPQPPTPPIGIWLLAWMNNVTSIDGTIVDLDRSVKDCRPSRWVGGSTDRSANALLVALLAKHFTPFNHDRRGSRRSHAGALHSDRDERLPPERTALLQGQGTSIRREEA